MAEFPSDSRQNSRDQSWSPATARQAPTAARRPQVVFYAGDYVRQMEDVLRGGLDAAVVTSGFLEEFFPELVRAGVFRYHLLARPAFQGQPYPFLTSTDVVPGYALAAAEHVPPDLRERVYRALSGLNATHPLSVAAGIAGFVAPASYELPRTVAIKVLQRLFSMHPRECLLSLTPAARLT